MMSLCGCEKRSMGKKKPAIKTKLFTFARVQSLGKQKFFYKAAQK